MRQFVFRNWVMVSLLALAMTLGACGDEPEMLDCESSADCGPDEICHVNQCVDPSLACFVDADCEGYETCVNLLCEERTSCEESSECAPDKTCSGGECVARQCNNDGDCFSGQSCSNGICEYVPKQCAAVGESCDPAEATRSGWACEDLGEGDRCYRECTGSRACINGQPDTSFSCGAGSVCVSGGNLSVPVCQPSQCDGFLSADEDCAGAVAADPAAFENGVQCSELGAGTFFCEPAGLGSEGAQCADNTDCEAGLLCVNSLGPFEELGSDSFCAKPCTSDDMCDGTDQCIGDDSGAFDGVGFCGERCEPFGTTEAQCSETVACTPVSGEDGLCFQETNRSRKLYDTCGNNTQCPDNSICVGLAPNESRCLPMCDPTLSTEAERDATCPGATTVGYVQLAHFGQGVPAVDVFVDGEVATTLSFGGGTDGFLSLEEGMREVEIRLAGTETVVFADMLEVDRRQALTIAAVARADGSASLLVNSVARDVSAGDEEASLRFVHGVAGADIVDVLLVVRNGSVTDGDDRIALIEGLGYGEATDFIPIGLGGTELTVDAYILPTQSFDGDAAHAVFEGVELVGGESASIFAVGDVQSSDPGEQIAPQLMLLRYYSAPEGRRLGGYCYDLNAPEAAPAIGSGICLETCRDSDDWGGSCSNGRDACSPVGAGLGWCFPAGSGEAGDSCEDDDGCGAGLFCDGAGATDGVCRAFCQPDEETNPELGCGAGETCIPRSGYVNFGECRLGCTPDDNFFDPNCPTGMQNCLGEEGNAYCSPSGEVELGEPCGDAREQNCLPGLVCAQNGTSLNDVIAGAFGAPGPGIAPATCREVCTPFVEDTGCGEGFACSPITPDGESTTLGHCVEMVETPIPSLDDCDASQLGLMCDENSFCIEASSNQCVPERGQCLQLCDFATGRGCSGNTSCIEGFVGGPLLGVFGLCQ